ncbi:hypothetical protein [Pantoea agglomerans]|uniref:hypothetical protein n=1 Tax=Enterobacter agglomerans TaxID=549 RepID=UPI002B1E3238|nr:hypothetical protein [Pantoea agglomerans]
MNDIYAAAGRRMTPDTEYNFTDEYLMRLRGVDFIPVRKRKEFLNRNENASARNYLTPLMHSVNKSRFKFQDTKK